MLPNLGGKRFDILPIQLFTPELVPLALRHAALFVCKTLRLGLLQCLWLDQ